MTRLTNNPDDVPAEAVAGFADAFAEYVKPVFGGVARSTRTRRGKIALVVGGGSGHYPAFAGWVGQGFADGAVCGNIVSSPSAAQAHSVCSAADRGAGVLIGFGNYAGDVLHFGQAVERLRGEGIDGCTLPGADHPLFTVPRGRMCIGLGIHGEPGIDEADLPTSDELAKLLVDGLLADHPAEPGQRVVAVLNGLGASKYEELFVVWHSVQKYLRAVGLELAQAAVGEFVTSLDMAGISLTLVFLDEELEQYWSAPCDTPAYRRGRVGEVERDDAQLSQGPVRATVEAPGSPASQALAACIAGLLDEVAALLAVRGGELGDLDAVAGDGDHGSGMHKGSAAAARVARDLLGQQAGDQTLLAGAGQAWSDGAGGTSGALWGVMLTAVGQVLGDTEDAPGDLVARSLEAALCPAQRLGGAQVGDKTMVDALEPASRARPLGQRSVGTPDPNATSLAMVLDLLAG